MVCHQPACHLSVCARGRHDVHDHHGDHDRHDVRGSRDVHGGSRGDEGDDSSAAVRSRQAGRNTPVPGACNRPGEAD